MVNRSILLAAAAFGIAGPALAQSAPKPAPATVAPAAPAADTLTRATLDARLAADFAKLDTNKDGQLDKSELAAAEAEGRTDLVKARQAEVQAAFQRIDADKDGKITLAEFDAALPPVPTAAAPKDFGPIIGKYDSDKSGTVSLNEFKAPMLANFNRLDANKDGKLSPAEQTPPRRAQTR